MARIYRGQQPCAGCGKPGHEEARFDKDGLCHPCQAIMNLGREVKDRAGPGYSAMTLAWYTMNAGALTLPDVRGNDSLGKFAAMRYVSSTQMHDGSSRHVRDTFNALLKELDEGKKPIIDKLLHMNDAPFGERFYMRTPIIEAMCKFLNAVGLHTQRCYDEGEERGSNLLVALNKGEKSLEDFENFRKKYE